MILHSQLAKFLATKNGVPMSFLPLLVGLILPLSLSQAENRPAEKPEINDFCGNPVETICSSKTDASLAREARIRTEARKIMDSSLADTVRTAKLKTDFNFGDLARLTGSAREKVYSIFLEKLADRLQDQVDHLAYNAIWKQTPEIKKYMEMAIDKNVPPVGDTLLLNLVLKNRIHETIVVSPGELILAARSSPSISTDLVDSFIRVCGFEGMKNNAFAKAMDSTKYLVVCPGLLLSARDSGRNDESNFFNLLQTLAHEWGHHIDSDHFPNLYLNMKQCLIDHYAGLFKYPGRDRDNFIDQTFAYSPARIKERRVETHLDEVIADFWGVETVAQYLNSPRFFKSGITAVTALRQIYGDLCTSSDQDDGVHPRGSFRIGIVMGKSPSLGKLMGCGEECSPTPACGLDLATQR